MITIKKITAREILDSRGIPTIETALYTSEGHYVTASVPSGESRGKLEGKELRDKDEKRYQGNGVLIPVNYINNLIGPKLIGVDLSNPRNIDYWLLKADGTNDYSKIGVNTMMSLSMVIHKAAALAVNKPLYQYFSFLYQSTYDPDHKILRIPTPIFNIINGGKHGNKNLDFQEYQVIPSTAMNYRTALEIGAELYGRLKQLLLYREAGISVSEEGGFTPQLLSNDDAFQIIKETILQTTYRLGVDIFTGIDFASSDYFKNGRYLIKDKPQSLKTDEYLDFIKALASTYNILILEDILDESDEASWKKCAEIFQNSSYITGDDFIGGNKKRLEKAIKEKTINGVVVKLNQCGTLSELIDLIALSKKAGIKTIVSHRLGETNDDLIADFAVGIQSNFIKFGSIARGERVAKYNRLLLINDELDLSKK